MTESPGWTWEPRQIFSGAGAVPPESKKMQADRTPVNPPPISSGSGSGWCS